MDLWVLIIGLAGTAVGLGLAGRRVVFLFRMITHGQPAPDRIAGVTGRIGLALKTQLVEVFGQKKLLKWSIPGTAHFFVFWTGGRRQGSSLPAPRRSHRSSACRC